MASNSKEGKGLDPPRVVFPASRAKYTKKADRGRKPVEGERPSTPVIPASRQAYAEAKKVEKSSALSPIERSRQRSARKKERLHTVGAVSGDAAVSEPTAAVAEDHPSATQQTRGEATGGDPYSVPLEDLESATASAANDVSLVPEPPLLEARIVSEREIVQAVPAPDLDANNQETEDRKGKILISRRWLYILGFILLVGATMAILFIAGALPSGQSNDDSGTPAPAAASSGESTDNNALSTAVDPTEVLTTVPPKEPTEGPARASSREPTNIPTEAPLENSGTELPTLEFLPDPQIGSSATMYDVRYAGRFQMVQEPGCKFPSPKIIVGCAGSVTVVSTSDPSIVCDEPLVAADGSSQVVCNNTCAGDACEKLFIGNAVEGDFGDLALFGEIYFLCTGPRVVDATGWMSMKPTGQGSCNTSATNDSIGAAFVTTQLGAYGVVVDNYVFDDLYFECNTDSISVSIGGVYSCTVGITCIDDACSFTIKPLNISADIHHFASQLIHSNDGSRIPSVPNPINGVSVLGSRTALFQVSSGFYYNETACSGRVTGLQMTCLNGTISLVQNQSTMVCSVQRNNMIQCNETRTAINPRNEYFPILRYECTAIDQVPQTTVENTDSSVECSFSEEQEVSLELQLGIICSDGSIMYDDYFYECGEQSTLVSREGNFTCGIVGVVPVAAGQVGFAVASIETDFRWGNMESEMCLSRQCNLNRMDDWCREFSSVARAYRLRDCYDVFDRDCYCPSSYLQTSDDCEQCNRENSTEWCRRFDPTATAIPGRSCYNAFEDDCQCPEGFMADNVSCVLDCHDDDPDQFCREQGGIGAFAVGVGVFSTETLDCWTDFQQHCTCFDQFIKQTDGCVAIISLEFVGNDGVPESAFPMQRCQGDCDADDDCADGLGCYMRDGFEPVPGCEGGEEEPLAYDYCVVPPV